MERSQAEGISVNVFISRDLKPSDIIVDLESVGLYDTKVPEHLRIIFGKVASRDVIAQIAQVPGVVDALEDVEFYPVLESS